MADSGKKILFPISVKLAILVTSIVVLSLGSITFLLSRQMRQDLRTSAEDGNFEANMRSALEAEDLFVKMRSDTMIITRMLASAGADTGIGKDTTAFFFDQNPRVAAIFFYAPSDTEGQEPKLLVNEKSLLFLGIDDSLVRRFINNNQSMLNRAASGETLILNAAPHFNASLLAMFFSGRSRAAGPQMVLFSPDNLNAFFGSGKNRSYLLNNSGDILIHADNDLVMSGLNISNRPFIREIKESASLNGRLLIKTDFDVSSGESGKNFSNFLSVSFKKVKSIIFSAFGSVKQFVSSFYNTCADVICDFLKIERKALVVNKIDVKTPGAVLSNVEPAPVLQFAAFSKLNIGGCIVITSVEYNKVFERISYLTRLNICISIAALLLSVMIVLLFAKSISLRLKTLTIAAQSIGSKGDTELQLTPSGHDEIGALTESFQKMSYAMNIFGKFTNKKIALKIIHGQIKPGGLQKRATIFFSGIHQFEEKTESFTNIFRDKAPNRIVNWLNDYFAKMIQCIEKTGGIVDKFTGYSIMAHWGAVDTTGNPAKDAFNCVKAALMMRKTLYEMNKDRQFGDPEYPPIRIGCGINSGIVFAGQIGSDTRMEYAVIGEPVNLASQIEVLTELADADILISEDTYNLVGDKFITEEIPSVTIKSKDKPVRIFAVINFAGKKNKPQNLKETRELLNIDTQNL